MSKKRRTPFETVSAASEIDVSPLRDMDRQGSGFAQFMRDHGVRETIESILVAVVLALMFRAFEAEAFIIPTGSMAPTLQGQHVDVVCEECGCSYRAGDIPRGRGQSEMSVLRSFCPICRYPLTLQPKKKPDHVSNNGDRILVNKFVYDFKEPERFDVIVFKNPNNGKQNYIKRLVGLPGDNLLIEQGDIYNFVPGQDGMEKVIVRKPIDKIDVMLQQVDDTYFISKTMRSIGWPWRWDEWSNPNRKWKTVELNGVPNFLITADDESTHWLRYRHLAPRSIFDERVSASQLRTASQPPHEWEMIESGKIPSRIKNNGEVSAGTLIRDYYEYNDRIVGNIRNVNQSIEPLSPASHWVGDLAVEADLQVESDRGMIELDLVEGGVHFGCQIDIATGRAQLRVRGDEGKIVFDTDDNSPPAAKTPLNKKGNYKLRYCQLDDMVYLWINGGYIDFGGSSYRNQTDSRPRPRYSPDDPGDAEPVGIGVRGATVRLNRLRVLRDIYYVGPDNPFQENADVRNETGLPEIQLLRVYENPLAWQGNEASQIFDRPRKHEAVYRLGPGEYFPMGDNSPASQDARIWDGDKHVDEEFLIGRAMFIYWPHSLNSPIKYFPNFKRMGFIR